MTRLTREAPARANIELGDVTHHNLKQLKKINTVVLPVSYNDKFYLDVLESGELAKLAYYNDVVVGAVCSRIDTSENMRRLYIMTLGCLYPYRRLGIGTVMVQHILNCVERDGNFDSIFLHVKVDNKGAIEFYKRFGFEIVETKQHYYKRIEPADAHVLQKTLTKKAAVAAAAAMSCPISTVRMRIENTRRGLRMETAMRRRARHRNRRQPLGMRTIIRASKTRPRNKHRRLPKRTDKPVGF